MKKLTALLVMLSVLGSASAEPCYPEGITFSSQTSINLFQSANPDCHEILGDVTICGYNILNLFGLTGITDIGGNLTIECTEVLTSLAGLENLRSLGGSLIIRQNLRLQSITALYHLMEIPADVMIFDNPGLLTLFGLHEIMTVGGNVWIEGNPQIAGLEGLSGITSIGGMLRISNNATLRNFDGLSSLTTIGGMLVIGSYEHLGGVGNPVLISLEGLYGLTEVGGTIDIGYNASLPTLAGLDNIAASSIAELYIYDNPMLTTCEVASICTYLATPGAVVIISGNATGCSSLWEVEQACIVISAAETPGAILSINPNPAVSFLRVNTGNAEGCDRLTIISHDGRVALEQTICGDETVVDVGSLRPGLYLVRVSNGRTAITGKFVRQ